MIRSAFVILLAGGFSVCRISSAIGYDPLAASRALDDRVIHTNNSLLITITITNRDDLASWRGFFFSDHVPSNFAVVPLSIALNGAPVTNYLFETGNEGDVYPGYVPFRWIVEVPTNFTQANPIPAFSRLEISYTLSSSSTGLFQLGDYFWAAGAPTGSNAVFGATRPYEPRTVKFVTSTNEPLLAAQLDAVQSSVIVDGVPGSIYVLYSSTNLFDWVPLTTNLSPFNYLETNVTLVPKRFFRASNYTVPYASLFFELTSTNDYLIKVHGVIGCPYVLEWSPDLGNWSSLITNLSPFSFIETNYIPTTYYRARLLHAPQ